MMDALAKAIEERFGPELRAKIAARHSGRVSLHDGGGFNNGKTQQAL